MIISVSQARPDQTAIVSAILTEAASWLIARGAALWRLGELTPAVIGTDVVAGVFHLAWSGGEAVGTMKLQLEDAFFWPDVPAGEAIYVHRLAVRRKALGGEVSGALLDCAADRAKELGRHYVRLDCAANRPSLRRVYLRHGFRLHSELNISGYVNARYERRPSEMV